MEELLRHFKPTSCSTAAAHKHCVDGSESGRGGQNNLSARKGWPLWRATAASDVLSLSPPIRQSNPSSVMGVTKHLQSAAYTR